MPGKTYRQEVRWSDRAGALLTAGACCFQLVPCFPLAQRQARLTCRPSCNQQLLRPPLHSHPLQCPSYTRQGVPETEEAKQRAKGCECGILPH